MLSPIEAVLEHEWPSSNDGEDVSEELRKAADSMADFFKHSTPEREVVRSSHGYTLVKPLK